MPISLWLVPVSLVLIYFYLIARNRGDLKRTAYIQPLVTSVSVVIVVLSFFIPNTNRDYTTWILVGLGLCFAADIFNIDMNNDKIFFAGMAFFFLAYIEYALTFTLFNHGFQPADIWIGLLFAILYGILMRLYWKNLGKFKLPVMVYGLVVPFMVTRAISTLFGNQFPLTAALLVTFGSLLLFLGDVEYGLHRFYKAGAFTIGPVCYGGGQLLIALSCTYFLV